ncbi:MAG TPA: sigma-70 family RNA polymerase sigma factor, partial [Actinomycetota bacterium]|nr:sigma-70 family RNA polymerase sigma factor [Actinomycetota bacterium]
MDDGAFRQLYDAHMAGVWRYARRRCATATDADDVVAETFAIAWRKLDRIPDAEPLPWLYAVARRVLANHRRGSGRRERLGALLQREDVATPIQAGEDLDRPVFVALA